MVVARLGILGMIPALAIVQGTVHGEIGLLETLHVLLHQSTTAMHCQNSQ